MQSSNYALQAGIPPSVPTFPLSLQMEILSREIVYIMNIKNALVINLNDTGRKEYLWKLFD